MVALAAFGHGHPAIDYLLLLAVADDGIGMVIIAAFYGDPANPVQPLPVRRSHSYIIICTPRIGKSPRGSHRAAHVAPAWFLRISTHEKGTCS